METGEFRKGIQRKIKGKIKEGVKIAVAAGVGFAALHSNEAHSQDYKGYSQSGKFEAKQNMSNPLLEVVKSYCVRKVQDLGARIDRVDRYLQNGEKPVLEEDKRDLNNVRFLSTERSEAQYVLEYLAGRNDGKEGGIYFRVVQEAYSSKKSSLDEELEGYAKRITKKLRFPKESNEDLSELHRQFESCRAEIDELNTYFLAISK